MVDSYDIVSFRATGNCCLTATPFTQYDTSSSLKLRTRMPAGYLQGTRVVLQALLDASTRRRSRAANADSVGGNKAAASNSAASVFTSLE